MTIHTRTLGMRRLSATCLCGTVGLLGTGCTVGPNYVAPQVHVMPDFGEQGGHASTQPATSQPSRAVSGTSPIVDWWRTFNDPVLTDLIEQAVSSNNDLRQATARVLESRAQRAVTRADLFPELNSASSYQHVRASTNGVASAFGSSGGVNAGGGSPPPGANGSPAIPGASFGEFDLYQAGFDASWELDVFGGRRRSVEGATANLQASVESRRDVLLTLLSEVARNYVDLRSLQRRLTIARGNLATQQQTVALTSQLAQRGVINQLDQVRAEAQVATTRATIPTLETAYGQACHRLAVLLGQQPTALINRLEEEKEVPKLPDEVPIGMPSDLLRRRPDVRRTERELAAATADIGVATADLYPRFSLIGSLGLQSTEPGNLVEYASRYYALGPNINFPLFDAGRRRAKVDVADAKRERALAAFEQSVLVALRDVEDALLAYGKAQERTASLRDAVASNRKAVRIARELYQQGVADFLSVLDAERSLFAAEDMLAGAEGEQAANLVSLYKALGGGWEVEAIRDLHEGGPRVKEQAAS